MIKSTGILKSKGQLADGSWRFILDCNEMPPEQLAEMAKLSGKFGSFAFAEGKITEKDVPEPEPEFKNEKSVSQRLRNVLYILWEKKGKQGEFEVFRKKHMEKIINQYKDLINDYD